MLKKCQLPPATELFLTDFFLLLLTEAVVEVLPWEEWVFGRIPKTLEYAISWTGHR